jgi:hypothetical protein
LTLARVRHSGDWYTGARYAGPRVLADALSGRAARGPDAEVDALRREAGLPPKGAPGTVRIDLRVADPVEAKDLAADRVDVAYLAGRQSIDLSDEGVGRLKSYLADGGFLLAEAVMGDKRADAAFRRLLPRLGLAARRLDKSHPLLTGAMAGAGGYALDAVRYRYALRAERLAVRVPELYALTSGLELVGVYSPVDLMYSQAGYPAWDCRGYEDQDARAVLTNILLLASTR